MPIIGPIASKFLFAFTLISGSVGAGWGVGKYSSERYSDIANEYVKTKYQNGYLDFWVNVSSETNFISLRTTKVSEMYRSLSEDSDSLPFIEDKSDLGKGLVSFCKEMRGKILEEKNFSDMELRSVGWCNNNKDGTIKSNKDMGRRDYWANLLVRTKYSSDKFSFWEKPIDDRGEQAAKYRDLLKMGYQGGMVDVLKEAKVKCDALRNKFKSGTEFTEKDLKENVPLCLPSIQPLR